METEHRLSIPVSATQVVSGLLLVPERPQACLVLAHGAGAGMTHPFMAATAAGLRERSVATLRYQFPYMEHVSRRPDTPAVAQAAVRAAVDAANRQLTGVALFAGGKSFGGRMTSQAQAAEPLRNVLGLAFLGFPLHPAGKPATTRAQHLWDVRIPMLFLQGARDALADIGLLHQITGELGDKATLVQFPDADHSFHVPARSKRSDDQVLSDVLDVLTNWLVQQAPEGT
jgi:predicted alpha/beta-hydrolase family hydrolase